MDGENLQEDYQHFKFDDDDIERPRDNQFNKLWMTVVPDLSCVPSLSVFLHFWTTISQSLSN